MNDVQRVAFDTLKEFAQICEQMDLRWYLVHGSALGAVKYGGFIPWDDDVDVAMPRRDYEMFCKEAGKRLPGHISLQNYKSNSAFIFSFSQLRNMNTTCIDAVIEHLDIPFGIYIDVFPLDGYPDEEKKRRYVERRMRKLRRREFCGLRQPYPAQLIPKIKAIAKTAVFRGLGYHNRTDKTIGKIENLITQYGEETNLWRDYGDRMYEKGLMPKEIYGRGQKCLFEGMEVIVPERYDEYLTRKYGDWRSDPPLDQQKSHHNHVALDPHMPYTEYLKQQEQSKKHWK